LACSSPLLECSLVRFKIAWPVDIGNQARLLRLPAQKLLRPLAGAWDVGRNKMCERAEMRLRFLGRLACLLVFDEGMFSEYTSQVLSQNLNIPEAELSTLPESGLYIFPGSVPGSLEDDRNAVGGPGIASKLDYTFRMKTMKSLAEGPGDRDRQDSAYEKQYFPSVGVRDGVEA
jgi:hypothetical protein